MRRFSHGGLLRFLTRERFRDPGRPFRELCVSVRLARSGVGTPEVAAARARRAPLFGWRLEVLTRRVEGAIDFDALLADARSGKVDARTTARLARVAGVLVRNLHAAGCVHADLTTKNMLVAPKSLADRTPSTWILDLDRAAIVPALTRRQRRGNLLRLYRYVFRREVRSGPALRRSDWARFLAAYEPDRAARRELARAVLRSHARSLAWHRFGWVLEGLWGGSRSEA